ncbi:MAG: DEAD/DEAH box helicase family protein [Defluviitaleaceae bacterium]|nr:DEAD/DEAH box helicase family protein [Defluviitaleaceae bacterium]
MTFNDVINKYCEISFSKRDKGTRFERLMRAFLLTDPKYAHQLKHCWLWEDFFARGELGGTDTGIDIVAQTRNGEFWAVQCKLRDESHYTTKPEVDTFLSTSSRLFTNQEGNKTGFSLRVWISTNINWNGNADNAVLNQAIPVIRIHTGDLLKSPVDWEKLENGVHGEQARTKRHTLLPHQSEAVNKATEYFKTTDRGKLIMACGTGKTFTALKIMEREADNFALVLVPSIALVGQVLGEWTTHCHKPINAVCVCSDPKITQTRNKNNHDIDGSSVVDLAAPATTDPERIIKLYNGFNHENPTIIFSTYHSIEAIKDAQVLGLPPFGLIVCDEAHRTTGVTLSGEDESAFVRVHDNDYIKAKKRLYMTATPKFYDNNSKDEVKKHSAVLCSMDDESIYGNEIYKINFGDAVQKELLADYKVLVLTVKDEDIPVSLLESIANINAKTPKGKKPILEADDGGKIVGCINALSKQVWGEGSENITDIDPKPMKRAVAFCRNILASNALVNLFNEKTIGYINALPAEQRNKIVGVEAQHIDGSMNAPMREAKINWLKNESDSTVVQLETPCKILSNVRCLSEGVDVPALDAIIFFSSRTSKIDIVQSVGRVMRKSDGKKYGYIIIPVVVPSYETPDDVLDNHSRYGVIWDVLNGLRTHDERFESKINKIELNKNCEESLLICGLFNNKTSSENSSTIDIPNPASMYVQMSLENFRQLQSIIYARIVKKVGSKPYWEEWAKSVADIAERQIAHITEAVQAEGMKETFSEFLIEMRSSIDSGITPERAIEMLAQHMITAPVFDALFENYAFAKNNAISIAMDLLLDELRQKSNLAEDTKELQAFYDTVRMKAKGIDNAKGRQKVIVELYNNFFKTAFKKMTEMLGIVYTPVEVVDFIVRSADDVLRAEFGRGLTDEGVNIFDPFTGTGTFITRLFESGLIKKEDLPRKYASEIFANEIVLLAYYIASVNIENTYHDAVGIDEYQPFGGIALTDTFQAWEESGIAFSHFDQNCERLKRQNESPITVIFGNPPYSVGQKSANDDAKNKEYPTLDVSISESYAKLSTAVNKNALYDSYIRAFRYATDRLRGGDGIVCFVSNGSWLDGNSTAGFRKSLEREFAKIYVFNLRGNQRTSGELSRREGGKIFGSGSRTPVSVTLLVKRQGYEEKAEILYSDIGDYLKREEKLDILAKRGTFANVDMELVRLEPNEHGDWITGRDEAFGQFIPLASEKKFDVGAQSFFVVESNGMQTNRDAWVYNFSLNIIKNKIKKMIEFYNSQIGKVEPDNDDKKISWSSSLLSNYERGQTVNYEEKNIKTALYRPFNFQALYYGEFMIHRRGQFNEFFPTKDSKNLIIMTCGIGASKDWSVIISDKIVDVQAMANGKCFPLYYYEPTQPKSKNAIIQTQMTLDETDVEPEYIRKDGISDFIFNQARTRYGRNLTKEDIFYYIYGFLHHPAYRTTFADDLKKSLPRIPLVETAEDFWVFSKVGRELAHLHLNYENEPPPPEVTVKGDRSRLHVEKMRFLSKERRDIILYNPHITIENIPPKAYEYIVNGKSAIDWLIERYQIKTDKASGITNNPNHYAEENNKPSYILDLLLSVIAVSVKTQGIIKNLPKVLIDKTQSEEK